MDTGALRPTEPTGRAKGQLRDGFRYVKGEPRLAAPLVMMAIVGMLAYEFQVTLPVVAKQTFHGGSADLRVPHRRHGCRRCSAAS